MSKSGRSTFDMTLAICEANRERTLATLQAIESLPDPQKILGWRPGPGRAHIAWQLVHIGVTEELFATERLLGTQPTFAELVPRFRGGSTPDDDIPNLGEIGRVLAESREHLRRTLSSFSNDDLLAMPPGLRDRKWTIGKVLLVLAWHEPHHQGQAHLTLNLYKASQP